MRFDDAVHHEFDGPGVNPLVMMFLAGVLNGVEVLRPELRRIQEVCDVHAHREIATVAHFVEKIEHFEILPGAVYTSYAVFVRPFHSRAKRQELFGASRFRNDSGDQLLGSLF